MGLSIPGMGASKGLRRMYREALEALVRDLDVSDDRLATSFT